ncbi:MAG: hypothetical protein DRJ34_01230 [Thermoprotei archaeon]|nr:MAG: hypothetical protein DRJ34_01230 [Thermoprotei archaeon]
MKFVDANVFIYTLIKSPKKDYEISKKILKRIEDGEEAIVTTAIIQEVIDWLEYNNRKREIETFLTAVNSYITMIKVYVSWIDMINSLDYVKKYGLDFVDALTIEIMKKYDIREIYSNDKDFDKIKWVRRIWR